MTAPFRSNSTALGRHVIADFFGASNLLESAPAHTVLHDAATAAGAIVLQIKLHDFGDRSGFTGVALLAESHISIHTWPEHDYAAIDIFMCGDVDPLTSLDVLRAYFTPTTERVHVHSRGEIDAMTSAVQPASLA